MALSCADAKRLVEEHGGITAAARATGHHRCYIERRVNGTVKDDSEPSNPAEDVVEDVDESGGKYVQRTARDSMSVEYCGPKFSTAEELLESAEIDLAAWEIVEKTVNAHEVSGKKANGQNENGRWNAESLWKTTNLQIKVKLKRRAPKPIQDAVRDLLKDFYSKPLKHAPVKRTKIQHPHLLELSLVDAHFGKLCWGQHTGTPYDLDIARDDYVNAVDELLDKVQGFKIDRIVFPVGNDFFQINNWLGTTAKGTVVDSVDDRFQKVFRVGVHAVEHAIRRCREIADVEVLWIPGNHDPETSWYLTEVLAAMFSADSHVKFDAGPSDRKYRAYGNTLIGYTHGDQCSHDKLPLLMATDHVAKPLWSNARFHYIRVGHFHKKKETKYIGSDTFNGVSVTILPSLSGTDKWHYEQGYVNNHRTAEVSLWSMEGGLAGTFSAEARSAR